jgi:HSP20 family protein
MSPTKKYWFPIGTFPPSHQGDIEESRPSVRFNSRGKWSPDTDIYEVNDGLMIIVDIAGIKKEEIAVVVEEKILSISGTRRAPDIPDRKNVYRLEIDVGQFEKRFRIPDYIDAEKVEARYENGFLYLKLPRMESRTIDISQG